MAEKTSDESIPVEKLKGSLWYIFNLDECCYNNGLNEVPEKWITLLNTAMQYLEAYSDRITDDASKSIMETGRELQARLQPLKFHKIHVEPVSHIEL